MPEPSPSRPPIGSLAIIAIVVAVGAGAFAYTAGWLSPTRLTPTKIVDSLAPPGGPSLGYRRNHAKGICFTGVFESNGNGAELSSAQVFARGEYPALGRFNLATADANAPDSTVRVRGLAYPLLFSRHPPGNAPWACHAAASGAAAGRCRAWNHFFGGHVRSPHGN